jgi:hypothetical protein
VFVDGAHSAFVAATALLVATLVVVIATAVRRRPRQPGPVAAETELAVEV